MIVERPMATLITLSFWIAAAVITEVLMSMSPPLFRSPTSMKLPEVRSSVASGVFSNSAVVRLAALSI